MGAGAARGTRPRPLVDTLMMSEQPLSPWVSPDPLPGGIISDQLDPEHDCRETAVNTALAANEVCRPHARVRPAARHRRPLSQTASAAVRMMAATAAGRDT